MLRRLMRGVSFEVFLCPSPRAADLQKEVDEDERRRPEARVDEDPNTMPSMDDASAPAILRLGDGAVLVIELLPDGRIRRTRIELDGSTSVEVVPRLQ